MSIKKKNSTKERIVKSTIKLMQASKGNPRTITIRDIAQKAKVGVGLINYHFQSKDKLLDVCVQRIVTEKIVEFNEQLNGLSEMDHIVEFSNLLLSFMIQNPQFAKISILSDFANPQENNNAHKIYNIIYEKTDFINIDTKRSLFTGILLQAIQVGFLYREYGDRTYGFDLLDDQQRKQYIHAVTKITVS